MQAGAVIFREGGGEPALGPVARGLGQRRGGDQHHAGAFAGRAQRGIEPGRTGADDGHLGLKRLQGSVRYSRDDSGARVPLASLVAVARHGSSIRNRRLGSSRSSTSSSAEVGSATSGSARRRRIVRSSPGSTRSRTSPRSRASPVAVGVTSTSTRLPAKARSRRRLHAAGGAVTLVDMLLDG